MKTRTIKFTRIGLCAALVLGLASALPNAFAEDTQKGGGKQIELINATTVTPIKTAADLEGVEAGDEIVMSCPKCKDVSVTTVTMAGKGGFEKKTTASQHQCPACKSALESVGNGKAKTEKMVHKCGKCGSEDAFCCVVKKGSAATKGMDK